MVTASFSRCESFCELQIDRQKATDAATSATASVTKSNNPGNANQRLATSATLRGVQTHATMKKRHSKQPSSSTYFATKDCVAPPVL